MTSQSPAYQNGCAGRRRERWTYLILTYLFRGLFFTCRLLLARCAAYGSFKSTENLKLQTCFWGDIVDFFCVCVWRRITSASFSGIFGSVAAFLLSLICMPHVTLRSCFLLNRPDLNWLAHVSYIPHIYTHCQSCESLICVFWSKHSSRRRIKGGERATLILLWV